MEIRNINHIAWKKAEPKRNIDLTQKEGKRKNNAHTKDDKR